jgi:hypothetical protein
MRESPFMQVHDKATGGVECRRLYNSMVSDSDRVCRVCLSKDNALITKLLDRGGGKIIGCFQYNCFLSTHLCIVFKC